MPFLRKVSYLAARADEIRDRPFARTIAGVPQALFRTAIAVRRRMDASLDAEQAQ